MPDQEIGKLTASAAKMGRVMAEFLRLEALPTGLVEERPASSALGK